MTLGGLTADTPTASAWPAATHRRGLLITDIGGTLFTFDVPLARLAMTDTPVHQCGAGVIVATTNTLANIRFFCALTRTPATVFFAMTRSLHSLQKSTKVFQWDILKCISYTRLVW